MSPQRASESLYWRVSVLGCGTQLCIREWRVLYGLKLKNLVFQTPLSYSVFPTPSCWVPLTCGHQRAFRRGQGWSHSWVTSGRSLSGLLAHERTHLRDRLSEPSTGPQRQLILLEEAGVWGSVNPGGKLEAACSVWTVKSRERLQKEWAVFPNQSWENGGKTRDL